MKCLDDKALCRIAQFVDRKPETKEEEIDDALYEMSTSDNEGAVSGKDKKDEGTFVFYVLPSSDPGLITGGDTVTIDIDSGNAGGDPGEFETYMKKVLGDWFDSEVTVDPWWDDSEGE